MKCNNMHVVLHDAGWAVAALAEGSGDWEDKPQR